MLLCVASQRLLVRWVEEEKSVSLCCASMACLLPIRPQICSSHPLRLYDPAINSTSRFALNYFNHGEPLHHSNPGFFGAAGWKRLDYPQTPGTLCSTASLLLADARFSRPLLRRPVGLHLARLAQCPSIKAGRPEQINPHVPMSNT